MSKKSAPNPQTSPLPGEGVDFIVRTMLEREATGKRPIRPKNVEDLLQSTMQDESDDPDFDYEDEDSDSDGTVESDEGSNNTDDDGEKGENGDSDESDDEDYQEKQERPSSSSDNNESDEDSDSSADESDSDGPDVSKKSALRETLQKLNNEANEFMVKRPTKKKKKKVKPGEKPNPKSSKTSKKKPVTDSKSTKAKSSKTKVAEASGKTSKKSKNKKVIAKKAKVSKKLIIGSKKRKKDKKGEENTRPTKRSISTLAHDAYVNQKENRKEIEVTKPICSACLGDKSDDSNEIVECDACGISVHESCYGLSPDNASISSGSGSSSCTEPWFCDVCKSGSDNIYCELCPVEGGLFKESTAGRWVHLVCAMYTQGVALHNDSSINLYEIHYSRWGSHNCAACENERQAQSGIAIPCDAGMCKTYFHATCAQKHGLSSDPNQVDFAEADPYYVSCKLHSNRETVKRRIKLFNTLQEQLRIKREQKELEGLPSGSNTDQARIFRKLNKVREKTALRRAQYLNSLENVPSQETNVDQIGFSVVHNLPSTWINGNKKQRLLHTAAKLGKDFLRKTERLGENLVAYELEVKNEKIISNVRRKWNVLPAMSVEYAAYYADRESRITGMIDQYDKNLEQNHELMDKEISLKDVWETHAVNQMAMEEETGDVSKRLESLVNIIQLICPGDKRLSTKLNLLVKPKELAGSRRKSPSTSRGDRKSPTPRRSSTSKKSQKNRLQSPSPSRKITIAVCDTCSKSDTQHLITRCDKCRKHYHLGCLDPPLSRMPKRTRLCGWMCSDCCDPPSEVDDEVDTEAPRTLRGRTKIHKPRKYRGSDDSEDDGKPQTETDAKPKAKKAKTSSFSSPEGNKHTSSMEQLPGNVSPQSKNSPVDRRRRSRSGSASVTVCLPVPVVNSPPTSPTVTVKLNLPVIKGLGKGKQKKRAELDLQGPEVQTAELEPKAKKVKGKRSTTPKAPKQLNQEELGTVKKKSGKRKSADGPLTIFKVNGLNDATIPRLEANEPSASKQKRPKKAKVAAPSHAITNGDIIEPIIQVSISSPNLNVSEIVKPKKPRKKKEPKVVLESPNSLSPKQENAVIKVEKAKKPRKKKEKVLNGVIHPENEVVSASKKVEKKVRKKSKTSVVPAHSAPLAARDESNGVNVAMEKVTSQFLVSKVKNGEVSKAKKRKSSTVLAPSVTANSSALSTSTAPEVKEKCVPPKKRKRAPSNAQLQQSVQLNNSYVDTIEAVVSSGNISDQLLENGDRGLPSNDLSVIMHGIAPNRQLPSGQIMQGNAMGSGVNSGEMVTVDASFLIDGAGQSTFNKDTTSTFYSSTNSMSTVVTENDGGVSFHIQNTTNTSTSDNVLRLQYVDPCDVPALQIPDSTAMPPPLSAPSSNEKKEICYRCTHSGDGTQLIQCDKCHFYWHFMCLHPPVPCSPRKKGHPWFCEDCDDAAAN